MTSIRNFVRSDIRLCFRPLHTFYFNENNLFFCLELFFHLLFMKVVILVDVFPGRRKSSEITVLILRDLVLSLIRAGQDFVSFVLQVNNVGLYHETLEHFTRTCFFLLAAWHQHLLNTCSVSLIIAFPFRRKGACLIKVRYAYVFYRYHRRFIREVRLVWNNVKVYTFFAAFLNVSPHQVEHFVSYFIVLRYFLLHFWNFIVVYRSVDVALLVQVDAEHIDRGWFSNSRPRSIFVPLWLEASLRTKVW